MDLTTTICAPATKSGGAIGIVRLSGVKAIEIAAKIFHPASGKSLSDLPATSLTFGTVVDQETNEIIDEALVSLFRSPRSFTGEDSVELSLHGSDYIIDRVMQLLIAGGATIASPGEFTKRAFLNGKIDLSQAEAVADLIASSSAASHRMAMNQMRGGFKKELGRLHDNLLHLTALLELELDFSDHEDLEFASRSELEEVAEGVRKHLERLCHSFKKGNVIKKGIPIAIVGETNAGKSTLLNALVGEERALVSNVHGTTRDTIEENIVIGDLLVRFIDTAGIRQTTDTVERLGIKRTFEKIDEAELVLWVVDGTKAETQIKELAPDIIRPDKTVMLLINKADLLTSEETVSIAQTIQTQLPQHCVPPTKVEGENVSGHAIFTRNKVGLSESDSSSTNLTPHISESRTQTKPFFFSARNNNDIVCLQSTISSALHCLPSLADTTSSEEEVIVSNARHYESLSLALEAINRVLNGLRSDLSGDFISQDLRECLHHLASISGEVTTEAVLSTIFSKFCIGK